MLQTPLCQLCQLVVTAAGSAAPVARRGSAPRPAAVFSDAACQPNQQRGGEPERARQRAARIHTRAGALLLLAAVVLAPSAASATVLLSVSGPVNSGVALSADEAAAAAFELTAPATDVTVMAPVRCLGCQGGIWLQSTFIGPGAGPGQNIFAADFPQTSSISIPSLASETYFLIFSVDSGTAIWSGSAPPTVMADHAVSLADFTAPSTDPFAPASSFFVTSGLGLNLTVSGTLAVPVPEPGTLPLSVTALGVAAIAAGFGRRFRENSRGRVARLPASDEG